MYVCIFGFNTVDTPLKKKAAVIESLQTVHLIIYQLTLASQTPLPSSLNPTHLQ